MQLSTFFGETMRVAQRDLTRITSTILVGSTTIDRKVSIIL